MTTVETLAKGELPHVDPVGTNYRDAKQQAIDIVNNTPMLMADVLTALIIEIQKRDKAIEMFEYNQKWRKRRP